MVQARFTSKAIETLEFPSQDKPGRARLRFLDTYSLFHMGVMPDPIPGKGEAVARIATHSLRRCQEAGVSTHYLGNDALDGFEISEFRILNPHESPISVRERAYFVPLQVVYRNRLVGESSIHRRLPDDAATLGLARREPRRLGEGVVLPPVIEYSTKLDEIDEYLERDRAKRLAALSDSQLGEIEAMVVEINECLVRHADDVGLEIVDGKLEFAIDEMACPVLVDVAGAPDENRFLIDGLHVSKQCLRDLYVSTGLREEVVAWAAAGRPASKAPKPAPLTSSVVGLASVLYDELSRVWTGDSARYDELRRVAAEVQSIRSRALQGHSR